MKNETKQLSLIKVLNSPSPTNSKEFNVFVGTILDWFFAQSLFNGKSFNDKLKLFFYILDKNEVYSEKIKAAFANYGAEMDYFHFFATSGINLHSSIGNELLDRISNKFSIYNREENNLAYHFEHLVNEDSQVEWILKIDNDQFERLIQFLDTIIPKDILDQTWNEALTYLISQMSAEGLDPKLQKRYFEKKINNSAFFHLNSKWSSLLKAETNLQLSKSLEIRQEFEDALIECKNRIDQAPELFHLKGVDRDLVYKLEKIEQFRKRISLLLKLKYQTNDHEQLKSYYFQLLKVYVENNNLLGFYSSSFSVLAKQIITINASKSADYIAKNKKHFITLFNHSVGGGILTAGTVILKFLAAKTGITGFWLGFLFMLNYTLSFLAIHYLHFTLATKQPATTASQLAHLLTDNDDSTTFKQLIDEIFSVLKSQFISVIGNLISVIPFTLIFIYSYYYITGHHFLTVEKAEYTLHSLKLISLVPIYAIFTGFILWGSGIIAGWVNNFFLFYDLNQKLKRDLGGTFSVVLSNIYLGFALGVLPEIFNFLHIPLDVRHITLSTGTLFAALPVVGFSNLPPLDYLNILAGLMVIAFFNIFTSFYITIKLSFNASNISKNRRKKIYKALFLTFINRKH